MGSSQKSAYERPCAAVDVVRGSPIDAAGAGGARRRRAIVRYAGADRVCRRDS